MEILYFPPNLTNWLLCTPVTMVSKLKVLQKSFVKEICGTMSRLDAQVSEYSWRRWVPGLFRGEAADDDEAGRFFLYRCITAGLSECCFTAICWSRWPVMWSDPSPHSRLLLAGINYKANSRCIWTAFSDQRYFLFISVFLQGARLGRLLKWFWSIVLQAFWRPPLIFFFTLRGQCWIDFKVRVKRPNKQTSNDAWTPEMIFPFQPLCPSAVQLVFRLHSG